MQPRDPAYREAVQTIFAAAPFIADLAKATVTLALVRAAARPSP